MSFSHKKSHLCFPLKTEMWAVNPSSRFLSLLSMHSKANISILKDFSFTTETVKMQPKKSVVASMLFLNSGI